jgi:hypothetical protein
LETEKRGGTEKCRNACETFSALCFVQHNSITNKLHSHTLTHTHTHTHNVTVTRSFTHTQEAAQRLTLPQWLPVGKYKLPGGIFWYAEVAVAIGKISTVSTNKDQMMLNCSITLNYIYSRSHATNMKPIAETAHV